MTRHGKGIGAAGWLALAIALGGLAAGAQTPPPPTQAPTAEGGQSPASSGEAPPVLVWPTPEGAGRASASSQPTVPDLATSESTAPASTQAKQASAEARKKKLEGGKPIFIAAPIPSRSPALGFGLTLVAGLLFKPDRSDKVSPLSMVGIAAFRAENRSQGLALGGHLYLKEDRYRVLGALGNAEIYCDYYGTGSSQVSYPLKMSGRGGKGEFLWRIAPKLYLGPTLTYLPMTSGLDIETPEALKQLGIEELALKSTIASLGAHLQWDTRDATIDTRRGSLLDFELAADRKDWGSSFDYQSAKFAWVYCWSPRESQTLAFETHARMVGGHVPFYAMSGYDLRGYTMGRYQDRALLIGQVEYRIRLSKRWGAVAFAGTGAVAPDLSSLGKAEWLPAAGAGLRMALSKKSRINLRLDYAVGQSGSHAVYFGVGEAF